MPRMLKKSNKQIVLCEVLRENNDLYQSDSDKDILTRAKIFTAMKMAKKMSKKLYLYKNFFEENNLELTEAKGYKKEDVKDNKDFAEDHERRRHPDYKVAGTSK